uniref:Uncharacterized protein n=1 Tax=Oncorhynchus mykiss TaxID=8022 RepID=A0A8C7UX22_ONCMY
MPPRPGELGQRLDSAAKHWLRPDLRTAAQVEQCVAMEQFLSLLPKEAGAWVQKQQPRDMEEAISMAEQRLGSGVFTVSSPAPTQTDTAQSSTEAHEQGNNPLSSTMYTHPTPTVSSQIPSPQSPPPLAPDAYHPHVQDSPVIDGLRSNASSDETELTARYTRLISEDGQLTWGTLSGVPSPSFHTRQPSPSPSHQCPDCGCCFAQQRNLEEHRNIHTGARPFVCGVCGKAFCHRRTLNKHTRIHSWERPFQCTDCGQTFKLKDTMKRHQVSHSKPGPGARHLSHSR